MEWLPKWRDLDPIEHRRHREAVEVAASGLDERDDIVLIGGALAGTSTARRAIANAWTAGSSDAGTPMRSWTSRRFTGTLGRASIPFRT